MLENVNDWISFGIVLGIVGSIVLFVLFKMMQYFLKERRKQIERYKQEANQYDE